MPKLTGKKVIITGASKGLGAVLACALANEGAKLFLLARSHKELAEVVHDCQRAEQHSCMPVDLTDMSALQGAIEAASSFLGGIDVVVHALGGGLGLRDPLLDHAGLQKLLTLNLGVAAEINRLVVPLMGEKGGTLVHVGSIASSEAIGSVGYNVAKAALAAYVRTLGRELAGRNVVVTGILPGGFIGPGNAMARLQTNKPEVYDDFIKNRLPRKKMGLAEEITPLLTFLCSEDASMMGGCLVPIDAGEGRAYQS
jgi:3-oxoacyl-[acyl-carrier protein] reductase